MICQPNLFVGTLFEEVDDTGALNYHWILCIHPMHASAVPEPASQAFSEFNLAGTAASTQTGKRISWDV